ncbi:MAG: hypothetical protein ACRC92_26315 [Peptostreptococcaceae bacterium]
MSNKKEVVKKIEIKFILSKECKTYIESEICRIEALNLDGIKCDFNIGGESLHKLIQSSVGDTGVVLTRTHDGELYLDIKPEKCDVLKDANFYAPSHLFLSVVKTYSEQSGHKNVAVCVSPTFISSLKPDEVVVVGGYVSGLTVVDVNVDVAFDKLRWY